MMAVFHAIVNIPSLSLVLILYFLTVKPPRPVLAGLICSGHDWGTTLAIPGNYAVRVTCPGGSDPLGLTITMWEEDESSKDDFIDTLLTSWAGNNTYVVGPGMQWFYAEDGPTDGPEYSLWMDVACDVEDRHWCQKGFCISPSQSSQPHFGVAVYPMPKHYQLTRADCSDGMKKGT